MYRKLPKISPGLIFVQRTFWEFWCAYIRRGLIFQVLIIRGNFAFQNGIFFKMVDVGGNFRKFTVPTTRTQGNTSFLHYLLIHP